MRCRRQTDLSVLYGLRESEEEGTMRVTHRGKERQKIMLARKENVDRKRKKENITLKRTQWEWGSEKRGGT